MYLHALTHCSTYCGPSAAGFERYLVTTDLSASFVRELTSTRALDEDTLNLKVLNPQLHIFESMYDNRSWMHLY